MDWTHMDESARVIWRLLNLREFGSSSWSKSQVIVSMKKFSGIILNLSTVLKAKCRSIYRVCAWIAQRTLFIIWGEWNILEAKNSAFRRLKFITLHIITTNLLSIINSFLGSSQGIHFPFELPKESSWRWKDSDSPWECSSEIICIGILSRCARTRTYRRWNKNNRKNTVSTHMCLPIRVGHCYEQMIKKSFRKWLQCANSTTFIPLNRNNKSPHAMGENSNTKICLINLPCCDKTNLVMMWLFGRSDKLQRLLP